ncbi:MAG: O-antigen ligase family protein, partial [Burkholderiales bacterium]|nr:O-antigen ligase family protein [Burkholderiales bacterium]
MNLKLSNILFAAILAIITIVPFAIPYAYFPISKFYSESISLLSGVAIFALAIFSTDKIKFPPVAIASFAFAAFALIQPLFVHLYFPGNNNYLALIFIICGLVAIGVSSIVESQVDGVKKVMTFISWTLVISATIQAIIAYLQYTGKAQNFSEFILYTSNGAGDGSNIFGNIGQPNQFTDFISIGVVALCYLFVIGQINLIVYIAYALLFACAITFTARRGVLLYYVIMVFTALWVFLRNRKNAELSISYKKILLVILGFFIGVILVQLALPKIVSMFSAQVSNSITGVERFSGDAIGQSTYRRFYEWYKAIILFTEHPFFGVGWYQYPREGIYIMQTDRFAYIPMNSKLYTHCHNSLFNIMAETGIVGTAILIGYGIGYSIFSLLRRLNSVEGLFAVLMA